MIQGCIQLPGARGLRAVIRSVGAVIWTVLACCGYDMPNLYYIWIKMCSSCGCGYKGVAP